MEIDKSKPFACDFNNKKVGQKIKTKNKKSVSKNILSDKVILELVKKTSTILISISTTARERIPKSPPISNTKIRTIKKLNIFALIKPTY